LNEYRVHPSPAVPDNDTLVLAVDEHVPVHVVGEGVDVRGRAGLRTGLGAGGLRVGTVPPT
jgi:hypothetical protein